MQHISTIYVRFICRELQLSPAAADELLADSQMSFKDVAEQPFMPYLDFFSFLKGILVASSDQELGLKVGKRVTPHSLGELGNAMLCAPTLADSLKIASSFAHIHAAYYQLDVVFKQDCLKITFIELADLAETRNFQTEVMMLLSQNMIEALTGETFSLGTFCFPYAKPDNYAAYSSFFNSPCTFDNEHAMLEVPLKYLTVQSPFNDPLAWEAYRLKLEGQDKKLFNRQDEAYSGSYTDRVRRFLSAQPPPLPMATDAATSLNVTERTLSRHLRSEGSSFRNLRNEILKEHAEFYLKESDLTIDAIACQLGYKDFSSFRRAFKLWFACSPLEFRNRKD